MSEMLNKCGLLNGYTADSVCVFITWLGNNHSVNHHIRVSTYHNTNLNTNKNKPVTFSTLVTAG